MEILVIQTAFPGDLFLSIPLLKQTRAFYPNAKIAILCREGMGGFLLKYGLVDRLFEIQKGNKNSYAEIQKQLQEFHFHLVLSPHRSFRTAQLVRGLKKDHAVSFKRWWNWMFFNHRRKFPKNLPDALRQLSLLNEVNEDFRKQWERWPWDQDLRGAKDISPLWFRKGTLPPWSSMQIKDWKPEGKKVYLAPGSTWAMKKWDGAAFGKLAMRLLDLGFEVILTGAKSDQSDCDLVAASDSRIVNECGKTSLEGVLERFSKASALIANDSGAIHMAAAVGLPTVALFGPTIPEFGFRPWNEKSVLVQRSIKRRPCSKHGTKKCPYRQHDCMNLSVDEVLSAFTDLMSRVKVKKLNS